MRADISGFNSLGLIRLQKMTPSSLKCQGLLFKFFNKKNAYWMVPNKIYYQSQSLWKGLASHSPVLISLHPFAFSLNRLASDLVKAGITDLSKLSGKSHFSSLRATFRVKLNGLQQKLTSSQAPKQ